MQLKPKLTYVCKPPTEGLVGDTLVLRSPLSMKPYVFNLKKEEKYKLKGEITPTSAVINLLSGFMGFLKTPSKQFNLVSKLPTLKDGQKPSDVIYSSEVEYLMDMTKYMKELGVSPTHIYIPFVLEVLVYEDGTKIPFPLFWYVPTTPYMNEGVFSVQSGYLHYEYWRRAIYRSLLFPHIRYDELKKSMYKLIYEGRYYFPPKMMILPSLSKNWDKGIVDKVVVPMFVKYELKVENDKLGVSPTDEVLVGMPLSLKAIYNKEIVRCDTEEDCEWKVVDKENPQLQDTDLRYFTTKGFIIDTNIIVAPYVEPPTQSENTTTINTCLERLVSTISAVYNIYTDYPTANIHSVFNKNMVKTFFNELKEIKNSEMCKGNEIKFKSAPYSTITVHINGVILSFVLNPIVNMVYAVIEMVNKNYINFKKVEPIIGGNL